MTIGPIATTVVGSHPQPAWLIDRDRFLSAAPPRVRMKEIWRVPEPYLEEAQDDATLLAIRDMERAGLDIITDGEARRESYSNRFATALSGVDIDNPGEVPGRTPGRVTIVPRIVGPIRRTRPVEVRDVEFLRRNTDRTIKITLPGPFTMAMQSLNEHYPSEEALAMDYAAAVNEEVRDLFAAGADIVQLDEPWMQQHADKARDFGVAAVNRALEGAKGLTGLHMCFGYAQMVKNKPSGYSFLPELDGTAANHISIEAAQPGLDLSILETLPSKTVVVGVIGLGTEDVETPDEVAARIRAALDHVPPDRLIVAPDCGMKYLSRQAACAKLVSLVAGARKVRESLGPA